MLATFFYFILICCILIVLFTIKYAYKFCVNYRMNRRYANYARTTERNRQIQEEINNENEYHERQLQEINQRPFRPARPMEYSNSVYIVGIRHEQPLRPFPPSYSSSDNNPPPSLPSYDQLYPSNHSEQPNQSSTTADDPPQQQRF